MRITHWLHSAKNLALNPAFFARRKPRRGAHQRRRVGSVPAERLEVRTLMSATVLSSDGRAQLAVNEAQKEIVIQFQNLKPSGNPEVTFDLSEHSGIGWTLRFNDLLNRSKTTVWKKNGREIGRDNQQRRPQHKTTLPSDGEIKAVVRSSAGNVLMRAVLNFAPVNARPSDIRLNSNTITEHSAAGTPVGTLSVIDADAADTHQLELLDDAQGRFRFEGSQLVVADGARIDFEKNRQHSVRVRATDPRGESVEKTLSIQVRDADDAHLQPLISRDGRGSALVDRTSRSITIHYAKLNSSGRPDVHFDFDLDGSSGDAWTIRFDDLLNRKKTVDWSKDGKPAGTDRYQESPSKVTSFRPGSRLAGRVIGDGGNVLMRAVIHIVNHAPQDIGLSHNTIPEHHPAGAVVGRLSVSDPDANDVHEVSLTDNAGGRFRVEGGRLYVADATGLDHESASEHQIRVRVKDIAGAAIERSFTINLTDIDDRHLEVVTSRDGRARVLIDHLRQVVTMHYLNADRTGSEKLHFDLDSLNSSGWTFQFDDLRNNRKTVTWYRDGNRLRPGSRERFPSIKAVPEDGGRLSAVVQSEDGSKVLHAVVHFRDVQPVKRDPVIVVMTHGWTRWLENTPSDWIPKMAKAMAAMTNRLGVGRLDSNVQPIRLTSIEDAQGRDELLRLWTGSPQFLAVNWTQQSNNGTAEFWDVSEEKHRRSVQRSAKALFRMIRARVNQYTEDDPTTKVDLLIVGHSFGTSVNRDLVTLLEESKFTDKLDLTKVVALDPVALKAKSAETHDQFRWRHPELSPVVDRVTSYYQTKGIVLNLLEKQLHWGQPLDGRGARAGDSDQSGGAPIGYFNSQTRVFNLASGTELDRFRHLTSQGRLSPGELTGIAYGLDGKLLATSSRDDTVQIRDAITREPTIILKGHRGDVRSLAFSPDGDFLATVSEDNTVRVWRVADGAEVWQHRHSDVSEVAWNADGSILATAGNDGRIKLFRQSTAGRFEQIAVIQSNGGKAVRTLVFDGDLLLSGGTDQRVRVWRITPTGASEVQTLKFNGNVRDVVVAGSSGLVAVASGRNVSVWQRQSDGRYVIQQDSQLHEGAVRALAVSPDGQTLVSGGDDNRLLVYELKSLRLEREIQTPMLPVRELSFNEDGSEIATVSINHQGGGVADLDVTKTLQGRLEPGFWEKVKKWFDRGVKVLKAIFDGDGYWDVAWEVGKIAAAEYIEEAKTRMKYHVTVPFIYIDDVLKKNGESFFTNRDNPNAIRYDALFQRRKAEEDRPPEVSLTVSVPDDPSNGVGDVDIRFSEPINGFDRSDLQLTRDGDPISLTGIRLVQRSETHFTIDLSSVTRKPGMYALIVKSDGSSITDQAGNPLAADGALQFEVKQAKIPDPPGPEKQEPKTAEPHTPEKNGAGTVKPGAGSSQSGSGTAGGGASATGPTGSKEGETTLPAGGNGSSQGALQPGQGGRSTKPASQPQGGKRRSLPARPRTSSTRARIRIRIGSSSSFRKLPSSRRTPSLPAATRTATSRLSGQRSSNLARRSTSSLTRASSSRRSTLSNRRSTISNPSLSRRSLTSRSSSARRSAISSSRSRSSRLTVFRGRGIRLPVTQRAVKPQTSVDSFFSQWNGDVQ